MSLVTLRRLLRARLVAGCDAAGIPPSARNWQGAPFVTPDPLVVHIRETLIPGAESVATIGRGAASTESFGLYQIDVYAPAGRGTADLDDAVEAIRAQFAPGTQTVESGVWLAIEGASPLAITESDRVVQLPLSITWRMRRTL